MNVFDIIGPVMIGPSSSHTAGAVKIGYIASKLLSEKPIKAGIILYGSFAGTYKGHGTDKALIAGLIGMKADDERIKESLEIAKTIGLTYSFETDINSEYHPNTTVMEVSGINGKKVSITGSSVGGGSIKISRVNNFDVEFDGQYHTLLIPHKDTKGTIAKVSSILASGDVNIARMKVFRTSKGSIAMMIIETDQLVQHSLIDQLGLLKDIFEISAIDPL